MATTEQSGLAPPGRLPEQIRRGRRNGEVLQEFSISLESVTPILGGSPRTRQLDDLEFIRVPSIRGHLRFWWRALQRDISRDPRDFFAAEAALWGHAAERSAGGRSAVEIRVQARPHMQVDSDAPAMNTAAGYALWPAASQPVAKRRRPGQRFILTLRAPEARMAELRRVLQAWILFGGYGSRTRRGLGSLIVRPDPGIGSDSAAWLPNLPADDEDVPADEMREEIRQGLAPLLPAFAPAASNPEFPRLAGATLLLGRHHRQAQDAWLEAVGWLKRFRQDPGFAREPGRAAKPGPSRWPEADKLRRLGYQDGHTPRYDSTAAWPRAEFGLPIVGQFTPRRDAFEITWKQGEEFRDRLASPLILKAMPTRQGFRACALWLARPYPQDGELIVRDARQKARPELAGSTAPFGHVGSSTDRSLAARLKSPLGSGASVQKAFIDWLKSNGVVQVAP